MAVSEVTSVDHKLFICCTSVVLLTILLYPWVLGISLAGFLIGFYLLDNMNGYVQNFILKYSGSQKNNLEKESLVPSLYLSDPLLHPILDGPTIVTTTTKENNEVNNTNGHVRERERGTHSPTTMDNPCSVCDEENCPRSDENKYSNPGQKRQESKGGGHHHQQQKQQPQNHHFKVRMIDERLDKSIAKFSKAVFDFYISSNWAPYETRKQLKLAFKKLLTNFAEKLQSNLIDEDKARVFCQDKVIPLLIHYIEKLRTSNNNSQILKKVHHHNSTASRMNVEKLGNLKTRRLCRQLLQITLPQEDQQCRLWMELCVSVLSDAVLWNLILLGRNRLPEIILNYVNVYTQRSTESIARPPVLDIFNFICDKASDLLTKRLRSAQNPQSSSDNDNSVQSTSPTTVTTDTTTTTTLNSPLDSKNKNCQENQVKSSSSPTENSLIKRTGNNDTLKPTQDDDDKTHIVLPIFSSVSPAKSTTTFIENNVPFLMNSFLDPVNDLEQPDFITSRWRPTLEEILVERELLYCLIQYLKGQRALEYLQAVLDDSPDGNVYCRKVLELEYLPGFCRSKIFMTIFGVTLVDSALEAGNDSPGSKRKHVRSSSYGSVNSGMTGIWKLGDPKVVDGLPIHTTANPVSMVTPEPDLLFKRRPHSVEVVIKKFLMSATKLPLSRRDEGNETKSKQENYPEPTRRVGINQKSYEDLVKEDVISQLTVAPWDIYDSTSTAVISWMNGQYWLQPIMSGWAKLLRPYLKSPLESAVKSHLDNFLSLETFIYCIDLVTEAFHNLNAESELPQSSSVPVINTEQQQSEEATRGSPSPNSSSQQQENSESTVKIKESLIAALHWFFNQIMDPKTLANGLKDNEDEIILFFIDLLDLLVNEVTKES